MKIRQNSREIYTETYAFALHDAIHGWRWLHPSQRHFIARASTEQWRGVSSCTGSL